MTARVNQRKPARPADRPRRLLPRRRWARALVWLAIALGYMVLLWYVVFPWVDRTFVNRPAV